MSQDGSTPGSIGFKTIMTSSLRPSKCRVESSDHGPLGAKWKILSMILQISVEYMAGGRNLEMNLVLSGFGTENGVSITISATAITGKSFPAWSSWPATFLFMQA